MSKKCAPYGTWPTPITSDAILSSGAIVDEVFVDPITAAIYHIEQRPSEGGRSVIVKTKEGTDVVGKEWNTRTGVHEYGGAAAIAYDGTIYFSNFTDGRVYATQDGREPEAITPENPNHRFANFAVHPVHTHLLVAIIEDHTDPRPEDVENSLCVINSKTKTVTLLVFGSDFYSSPCFSPDGSFMVWQEWNHPDMSWEGAELYITRVVADQASLVLVDVEHVAGQRDEISATHPMWVSDDLLLFTSDESGYQNPWTYSVSANKAAAVLPSPVELDFSLKGGLSTAYGAVLDRERKSALFTALKGGRSVLFVVNLQSGTLEEVQCPYVTVSVVKRVTHDAVVFLGRKSTEPQSIVLCTLKDYSKPQFTAVRASADAPPQIPPSYISVAQPITLKVPPADEPLHVVYYPPTHPEYVGADGEKPPCVVNAHGGPTGHASQGLNWEIQYFTSRGWAWLDVNYGGSDGYGRKYIERLKGEWGVVDVQDCVRATQQLSAPPYSLIDPERCVIRGGSAGGFTALATICTYPKVFAASTSMCGISNLRKLDENTHKYESHYAERLIGGTVDEVPELYDARSPVTHADKIEIPLLVLQGSIDAVVPPEQAEFIVDAIRSRGGHVEYVVYEGEGHGWRKAETIKAAAEKELDFYERVLGLAKAG